MCFVINFVCEWWLSTCSVGSTLYKWGNRCFCVFCWIPKSWPSGRKDVWDVFGWSKWTQLCRTLWFITWRESGVETRLVMQIVTATLQRKYLEKKRKKKTACHLDARGIYRHLLSVTCLWHRGDCKPREWSLSRASGTAARTQPSGDTAPQGKVHIPGIVMFLLYSQVHMTMVNYYITAGHYTKAPEHLTGWACSMQQRYIKLNTSHKNPQYLWSWFSGNSNI